MNHAAVRAYRLPRECSVNGIDGRDHRQPARRPDPTDGCEDRHHRHHGQVGGHHSTCADLVPSDGLPAAGPTLIAYTSTELLPGGASILMLKPWLPPIPNTEFTSGRGLPGREPADADAVPVDRDLDRGVRLVRVEGPALDEQRSAGGSDTVQGTHRDADPDLPPAEQRIPDAAAHVDREHLDRLVAGRGIDRDVEAMMAGDPEDGVDVRPWRRPVGNQPIPLPSR